MKNPIVVVGMGELGSVFARGFLKLGFPVQGVTRTMSMQTVSEEIPNPTAVLIAVGENDLHATLEQCPEAWKDKMILLQNELLPRDWQAAGITLPTVISVWFEKKKGMDSKVVLPSPVFGPNAKYVFDALSTLDLPAVMIDSESELEYELVRKNLYILTTNIAGLEVGGTVKALADEHKDVMNPVAEEILDIQAWLTQKTLDRTRLMKGMLEAFEGDPDHKCMGRSAPGRLARALAFADNADLEVPKLREIQQQNT